VIETTGSQRDAASTIFNLPDVDPAWQVRRRLLTAHEHLRPETFTRMWNSLIDTGDPGLEILGAYVVNRRTCDPCSRWPGPTPNDR
jgi:hypothetical protein